jgi:hypothetical protein
VYLNIYYDGLLQGILIWFVFLSIDKTTLKIDNCCVWSFINKLSTMELSLLRNFYTGDVDNVEKLLKRNELILLQSMEIPPSL